MRTTSTVHSPQERLAMRQWGERRALQSQWRLLLAVCVIRTAVTRILPLAGSAAWWVTLLCLVPGYALYGLGCLGMRLTQTETLTDCLRTLMGQAGVWLLHGFVFAALAVEGVSSITALITLFTQGVGVRGTQLTLALVTAVMLLFCLHREGLARGIYLLRWILLAMVAAVLTGLAGLARVDQLCPWMGNGQADVLAALRYGAGMGWPMVLPLLQEPVNERRRAAPLPPLLLGAACVLCLNLALPHELLVSYPALADSMVLTVACQGPMLRLISLCLWMVALFLSLGSAVSLGAQTILAPAGRAWRYLPGILAVSAALTQMGNVGALWRLLGGMEPWLLVPLGAGAVLSIIACWRKKA